MAMFSSARLALRRSLAAAPRAASPSLGAGLGQFTEESSSRRLLHFQLLPRLFSCDASGSNTIKPPQSSGSKTAADLEMEYKRRFDEKRQELIHLFANAVDTCEPACRERIIEKQRELQQVRQEYRAKTQVNGHNSDIGATMSKTAGGGSSSNLGEFMAMAATSIFLGLALSELGLKLSGRK